MTHIIIDLEGVDESAVDTVSFGRDIHTNPI